MLNAASGAPGARILGLGDYRPNRVMTNADLEQLVDTSDEWIRTRVGVRTRGIADDTETLVAMATASGGKALAASGRSAGDIDLIIVATCTPLSTMPTVATRVAAGLGIKAPGAYDLNAACAGFCYGLAQANDAIRGGSARYVLLIGTERLSDWIDWTDRSTCIIFGDGSGAAVIGPADEPGIGPVIWGSDGQSAGLIYAGDTDRIMHMAGQSVFRWATTHVAEVAMEAVRRSGLRPGDLAAVVPHQANLRIVEAIAAKIGATNAVIARDIVDTGNTSAASVPLALTRLVERGEVGTGDPALVVAFGAGLTYAGQVIACP